MKKVLRNIAWVTGISMVIGTITPAINVSVYASAREEIVLAEDIESGYRMEECSIEKMDHDPFLKNESFVAESEEVDKEYEELNYDNELNVPGKPEWTDKDRGLLSFATNNNSSKVIYRILVEKNGEFFSSYDTNTNYDYPYVKYNNGIYSIEIATDICDSAVYRLKIKATEDETDWDFTTGAISDYSDEWNYVRPKEELPMPQNLRWSNEMLGVGQWDYVPGASLYEVWLYEEGNPIAGRYCEKNNMSFSDFIKDSPDKSYTFTVQALSNHLTTVANGRESIPSPIFVKGEGYKEKGIVVNEKCNIAEKFIEPCDKYEVTKDTKKIASVTKAGIVTGKKAGTAVIVGYKKAEKNRWDEVGRVEVEVSLPNFTDKKPELTYPGATFDAANNMTDCKVAVTEWKSSKESVATVDKNTGLVTAVGKGQTKITAVFGTDKMKKEYSFILKVNIPVKSKISGKLLTGGSLKLKLTNTKKPITWSPTVYGNAIVDQKGKVSLVNAGDAEIVATVDGIDYTWNIKIEEPKIKGNDTITLDLKKKKKAKLSLTNTKYKATDIKWIISEDSDPDVISIDDKGNVTALKAGKVDVYTETGGVKNTYHIMVNEI